VLAAGACSSDTEAGESTTTTAADTETTSTTAGGDPAVAEVQPGSIDEVAPTGPTAPVAEPVAIDAVATFSPGVTASITDLSPIEVEAQLPGEKSGPAIRVTLRLDNGGPTPIDLSNVAVVLTPTTGVPVAHVSSTTDEPFTESVEPGASATGTYVFGVAPSDREGAQISMKFAADQPTVVFAGNLPQ
jgi:hypothetical protein